MKLTLKRIGNQVVVITGATSGIGLATAKLAAKRGAKLVLSSRNEADLESITAELRARGCQVVYVVADVSDEHAVQNIAQVAANEFGGFDTWINNAGISIYGKLTETTMVEKKRIFDVNFWGVVYGCKAAIPYLKKSGGALINIGSILSDRAIPLQGIYTATKHAVKGYTDTLRMELESEGLPISVTLVKPAAIDTPYPIHAQNHLSGEPTHTPPVYHPNVVARAIIRCAEHPVRDVLVGGSAKLFSLLEKFAPRAADRYMEKMMLEDHQSKKGLTSVLDEGLFKPPRVEGSVRGDYSGHVMRSSLYTTMVLHPLASFLVVGGLASIGAFLFTNSRRRIPDYYFQEEELSEVQHAA